MTDLSMLGTRLSLEQTLPLSTGNLWVLAPAMRPFRPVFRLADWKFGGIGEYQVCNQIFAHDGEERFYADRVERFPLDVPVAANNPSILKRAFDAYTDYVGVFYEHIVLAEARGVPYGAYVFEEETYKLAERHLKSGEF